MGNGDDDVTGRLFLQPGDIFCSKSSSLLGKLIRFGTKNRGEERTKVNHVGNIVSPGSILKAEVVEALTTVVRHNLYDAYGPPCKEKVIIFRHRTTTLIENELIARKAMSYVGKKYGWFKLVTHAGDCLLGKITGKDLFFFRRITRSDRYPICSWVTEHAEHEVGRSFGKPLGSTTPDDIHDYCMGHPDEFEVIYPLARLRYGGEADYEDRKQ